MLLYKRNIPKGLKPFGMRHSKAAGFYTRRRDILQAKSNSTHTI